MYVQKVKCLPVNRDCEREIFTIQSCKKKKETGIYLKNLNATTVIFIYAVNCYVFTFKFRIEPKQVIKHIYSIDNGRTYHGLQKRQCL